MPSSYSGVHRGNGSPRRQRRRARAAVADALPTAGSNPQAEVNVGARLRALRAERSLSIRELAETSGLAINTLSLIENSRTSPSVSTLQQLAQALSVPITAFFETDVPPTSVVYLKASQRARVAFARGTLEDLGAGLADRAVQPCVVTLEPNAGSGAQPIVHTGYELVYCLKGRITYTIEARIFLLDPGDSLLFESRLPHQWQNVESEPSQMLLVLYPTDERDRPTERHFALAP